MGIEILKTYTFPLIGKVQIEQEVHNGNLYVNNVPFLKGLYGVGEEIKSINALKEKVKGYLSKKIDITQRVIQRESSQLQKRLFELKEEKLKLEKISLMVEVIKEKGLDEAEKFYQNQTQSNKIDREEN